MVLNVARATNSASKEIVRELQDNNYPEPKVHHRVCPRACTADVHTQKNATCCAIDPTSDTVAGGLGPLSASDRWATCQ